MFTKDLKLNIMKAPEFKQKLIELKDFLKDKELIIELTNDNKIQMIVCSSLNNLGLNVLKLEKELNTTFNFLSVSNDYIEKSISTENNLKKWVNEGVWTSVKILATTYKY